MEIIKSKLSSEKIYIHLLDLIDPLTGIEPVVLQFQCSALTK